MLGTWRARLGILFVVVGSLLFTVGLVSPGASAAVNALAGWTAYGSVGHVSDAAWQVNGDGLSVNQTNNGAPGFFVSPYDISSGTITVDITPSQSSDDDFIGFVLGYTKPLELGPCGVTNCAVDTVLFDWKQGLELGEPAGANLTRVNGTFNIRDKDAQLACFFTHDEAADCHAMAPHNDAIGPWVEDVNNKLKITYTPTHLKVERVSPSPLTIFDLDGAFPAGRFGFYNYSQAGVKYAVEDFPADPTAVTTTTAAAAAGATTTSTTVAAAATTSTTRAATTTTARVLARTGSNNLPGQFLAGVMLMTLGAAMLAARGKRPWGAHFGA